MNHITSDEENQSNPSDLSPEIPLFQNIPKALRDYEQWVCWEYSLNESGERCATPVSQMGSLEDARKRYVDENLGLGFVLKEKGLFAAVHLPDCFGEGSRQPRLLTRDVMSLLNTYAEIDDTNNGLHLIIMATGEGNRKAEGIELWTQDYMVPITGQRYSDEVDVKVMQKELKTVVEVHFGLTWLQKVERMKGSGTEQEVLARVLTECLGTPNWLQDADRTDLYPFLGRCWGTRAMRTLVRLQMKKEFMSAKMAADIEAEIEEYVPKKEKVAKTVVTAAGLEGLQGQYQWTKQGQIKESQANWETMLEQEPQWQGRFRFNEFHHKVELDGEAISELSRAQVSSWASHNLELSGSNVKNRDQALLVVSAKDKYDPLQEYINGLPPWDGINRLETLFPTYFGTEDNVYAKWLGRTMPVCMIARALVPACICRYVVVLKGPQDIGKSEAVRALGGEWTTELSGDLGSRDSQIQLKGIWVVELGELNSVRKTHRDEAKRFVSSRYDEFTLKHLNDGVKYERRCIFIGTSNADEVLNDPTGSTRWFPIKVTKADYQAVAKDRNQLLAEALVWYRQHEHDWWSIPAEVKPILDAMREESREVGPYEETISKWLMNGKKEHTTWPEIAKECLNLPEGQWKSTQMSVADSLRALGWTKKQELATPGSKRKVRRWYPPDNWPVNNSISDQKQPVAHVDNTSDEPENEMEFMLGRSNYARPIAPKFPCRVCGSAIDVDLVTGNCRKCH